jgi:mannose-6-phosphate isomerase-like protein (cupin superfamily)
MHGYIANIEKETLANEHFRKVLYTGPNSQLVVMTIQPGEDIGMETHEDHDQFLRIERGEATVILNGEETAVKDDFAILVPAGTEHNVVNTSADQALKLYTIYAPPEHAPGTIHRTKADAAAGE